MTSLYSLIIESVVGAFCLGGVIGAVVVMHAKSWSKRQAERNGAEFQELHRRIPK